MTETSPPHVIIIGAGFAGLSAVAGLRRAGARVTIIDKNLYSAFQPLLYQVATGGLNPGDIAYPVGGFTARRGIPYIRGELAAIDDGGRTAKLDDGREFNYDYLVISTGVAASYFGLPGAAEHTFGLYNRGDAIVLRDHIMNGFEQLSADSTGEKEFHITVVGGGATGVEMAGTLGELRSDVLRATFPDVEPSRIHVRLIEMAPNLLTPFDEKLREYSKQQLENRGVELLLSTKLKSVGTGRVVLDDGDAGDKELRSDLTIWAAGVSAPASVRDWGLPQGRGGRIEVGPDLRVTGQERIFAAGDIAIQTKTPSPQLAPAALQEGKHVASQIIALMKGNSTAAFAYHDRGIMATIGAAVRGRPDPEGPQAHRHARLAGLARAAPGLPAGAAEPDPDADQPVLAVHRVGSRHRRHPGRRAVGVAAGRP
jgi:NADH:quinone reductase (non-electrogenic)